MAPKKSAPSKTQTLEIIVSDSREPNKTRRVVKRFPIGLSANEVTDHFLKSLGKMPFEDTRRHLKTLQKEYEHNRNPSLSERKRISNLTGLSQPQVYSWFYRRRLNDDRAGAAATHGVSETGNDNFPEENEQELANATTKNNEAERNQENFAAPSTSTSASSSQNPGFTGEVFRLPETPLNLFLSGRTKYLIDPKNRKCISVIEEDLKKIRELSDDNIRSILTDRWKPKASKLFKLATKNSPYKKSVWEEAQKLEDMLEHEKLQIFTNDQLHFLEVCRMDFLEKLGPGDRCTSRLDHRATKKVVIPFTKLFIYSWFTFQDGCRLNLYVALSDFTKVTKKHNNIPWLVPNLLTEC